MATTTGPLMSMEASGTIGKTLTFARWKGRAYVRTRVIPHNPRSAGQYATRAMMAFLTGKWATVDPIDQATWKQLADATKISEFNAYVQANLKAFTQFLFPSTSFPILRASPGVNMATLTAVGGVGLITGTATTGVNGNSLGIAIALSNTTGFDPGRNNVRLVLPAASASPVDYTLTGVVPGNYFVRAANFNLDGTVGDWIAQQAAAVT